jgi:MmeI, DNA-methyltransferase domain
MMDHIMNNRLSLEFGLVFARIPLRSSPHICNADALETDWSEVIAPENCSYVFGNPPFSGAKYRLCCKNPVGSLEGLIAPAVHA